MGSSWKIAFLRLRGLFLTVLLRILLISLNRILTTLPLCILQKLISSFSILLVLTLSYRPIYWYVCGKASSLVRVWVTEMQQKWRSERKLVIYYRECLNKPMRVEF
jgi:hypothetical protein